MFYTRTTNARIASGLSLENQLRRALDKGELVFHYQPKVDMANGSITGAEPLIRWNPGSNLKPAD
jgi:sensor c-di-GMP phosphodiesterase-like protein